MGKQDLCALKLKVFLCSFIRQLRKINLCGRKKCKGVFILRGHTHTVFKFNSKCLIMNWSSTRIHPDSRLPWINPTKTKVGVQKPKEGEKVSSSEGKVKKHRKNCECCSMSLFIIR